MINCKRVQDVLSDFIEGSLYEKDLHHIEDHLSGCATCNTLYERVRGTIRLLDSLPAVSPSVDFEQGLREKLHAERNREGKRFPNRLPLFPFLRPRPIFALVIPIVAIGLGVFLFRGSIFQEQQPVSLATGTDQTKIERFTTPPESTSADTPYQAASGVRQNPNYILSNMSPQTFDLDGVSAPLLWESAREGQFLSGESFMDAQMNVRRPVKYILSSVQPPTIMKTVTFDP